MEINQKTAMSEPQSKTVILMNISVVYINQTHSDDFAFKLNLAVFYFRPLKLKG